jgi:hypothetical protein
VGPSVGYTACRKVRFPMLEPDAGKLARPVLRGGSGGNAALLPDPRIGVLNRCIL